MQKLETLMGSCLSCLRDKGRHSAEREPLLPRVAPPPPVRSLDRGVDILAALQSGKYPSQSQLNVAIQLMITSSLLQSDDKLLSGGPLSDNGRRIVQDVRVLLESVLQLGMEKNSKLIVNLEWSRMLTTP